MDTAKNIFEHLEHKPFSLRRWYKKNSIGILSTLIFHVFLLILFMVLKINSLNRQVHDLGVTLDFTEPPKELTPEEKNRKLTPSEMAYLEKILSQRPSASNQASNVGQKFEENISTQNYIQEVEKELDQSRSEEWKKMNEELQQKKQEEDYVPADKPKPEKKEVSEFRGITNITYEFLESPKNRNKTYMPVPVYKCRGEGTVLVDITVDQSGRVTSSKAYAQGNFPDKDCMVEVAENYSSMARFQADLSAPKEQKGRIVYKFIAQ